MSNDRFVNSFPLDLIIFRMNQPAVLVALAAVLFYYGLPLAVSIHDGSLVTRQWISANPMPAVAPGLSMQAALDQATRMQQGVGYAQDTVHLLFSCLIFFSVLAWVAFLRHLDAQLPALASIIRTPEGREDYKATVARWTKLSRSMLWSTVCLVSAVVGATFFYSMSSDPGLTWWWGHASHGYAGLTLSLVVGVMLYFALKFLATLIGAMAIVTAFLRQPIEVDPFHPDEANGLLPVGKTIMMFWSCALIIGLAVSLVNFVGYLDIDKSPIGRGLSLVGIVAVPLLSAVPFVECLRAIEKDRRDRLAVLATRARELYQALAKPPAIGQPTAVESGYQRLADVTSAIDFIRRSSRFPFDPRASMVLVAIYAAQIALFVYKLLR
jgi:hypothetical protein